MHDNLSDNPPAHKPIANSVATDSFGQLACPRCRHECGLHHYGVTTFDREEDAETVCKTHVRLSDPFVDDAESSLTVERVKSKGCGNPSERRGGLLIHFYCELCGGGIDLTVAQSKGHTYLRWRFSD